MTSSSFLAVVGVSIACLLACLLVNGLCGKLKLVVSVLLSAKNVWTFEILNQENFANKNRSNSVKLLEAMTTIRY